MTIDIQVIKNLLQREAVETEDEEQFLSRADEKLEQVLHNADGASAVAASETIRAFADTDEVSRRKLLAYCVNFVDPTLPARNVAQGTQVCFHVFLQKSDLYKLADFVNSHRHDAAFGETVNQIMDSHGMTAPQVYKNAMLRRQDFARATSFSNDYNVTKRVAWQIIIGLHCNLEEADAILFSAGYLRRKNDTDLTMEYFIQSQNYDIVAINDALSQLGLKQFPCWEPGDPTVK